MASGQRGAGHDRREVADGVAPALVLLAGRDHRLRQGGARRAVADRDQRRRRARPSRAAGSASLVAHVPPSCETAEHDAARGGRPASSNAWALATHGSVMPASAQCSHAAGRRSTMAACSLVPQPVVTIGAPASAAPIRSAPPAVHDADRRRGAPPAVRPAPARRRSSRSWRRAGPSRGSGIVDEAHGSGAPGSGASGSNVMAAMLRGRYPRPHVRVGQACPSRARRRRPASRRRRSTIRRCSTSTTTSAPPRSGSPSRRSPTTPAAPWTSGRCTTTAPPSRDGDCCRG